MRGFQNFLLRGNVVDLAVAVVIGVAFGAVVTALVKDIITPIIGIAGGLPDFSAWVLTIGASKFSSAISSIPCCPSSSLPQLSTSSLFCPRAS